MKIEYFKPTSNLSNSVRYYWTLEAEDEGGQISERIIPTGSIQMIIHFGRVLQVDKPGEKRCLQPSAFISGQSSAYSDVISSGRIGMVAIVFTALGAKNFFDFPMNMIENQIIDLSDLIGSESDRLQELILRAANNQQRIYLIEEFLLKMLKEADQYDLKRVNSGVALVKGNRGMITSVQMADRIGISVRQLERKFSVWVGKSPKQYSKVVRFQSILDLHQRNRYKNLTSLAYEHGYYDQAHFIHDFKRFTGHRPNEFFKLYEAGSDFFNDDPTRR